MSLEKNIERIADALGIIALAMNDEVRGKAEAAGESETSASGRPKATRKDGKKSAADKKKDALAARKAAKKAEEPTGPTREDVSDALVEFCKNGPGKTAAKEILEEFKAGSISTLDVKTYEAFIDRLNEVSGG